ncbi:hypothetical protein RR46_14775 [Papilio xuthus]|uniref:Uncharacterized protein n=1 Tax=Papilio xuthus TaxID=66420 RepID=A0A194PD66_PAPXU|nr:hypothetical protein RR46_14775 [Papilio xuthus]
MVYGKIKKLLPDNQMNSNEIVLIESHFLETSRSGKYLRSVILGNIATTIIPTWLDKHLYLGEKRAIEDKNRPVPVPGLGKNVEVKSLYVKPQYFGHWDESEQWVQCGYNTMISEI